MTPLLENSDVVAYSRIDAISICSGIGGLDRAFHRVFPASRVVMYCEREISAAAVLASRMETQDLDSAAVWSDLESITGPECSDYVREATGGRGIVALFGGPPCQDFSVAGKRLQGEGKRNMFPATLRAIEHYKPGIVFLENVPGSRVYVSERVVPVLHGLGYRVPRPILLEAAAVGASQKRERLFILAYRDDAERRADRTTDGGGTGRQRQRDSVCVGGVDVAIGAESRSRRVPESDGRDDATDVDGCIRELGSATVKHGGQRKRRGEREAAIAGAESGTEVGCVGVVQSSGWRRRECESREGPDRGTVAGGTGGEVGDAEHSESRDGENGRQKAGQRSGGLTNADRQIFGAFPPGPGLGLDRVVDKVLASIEAGEDDAGDCFLAELAEWAKWQRILEVRPDLAPATVERGVCGVASKLPRGLDEDIGRTDKLRGLGNAVVADQAELALRILLERLRAVEFAS